MGRQGGDDPDANLRQVLAVHLIHPPFNPANSTGMPPIGHRKLRLWTQPEGRSGTTITEPEQQFRTQML